MIIFSIENGAIELENKHDNSGQKFSINTKSVFYRKPKCNK